MRYRAFVPLVAVAAPRGPASTQLAPSAPAAEGAPAARSVAGPPPRAPASRQGSRSPSLGVAVAAAPVEAPPHLGRRGRHVNQLYVARMRRRRVEAAAREPRRSLDRGAASSAAPGGGADRRDLSLVVLGQTHPRRCVIRLGPSPVPLARRRKELRRASSRQRRPADLALLRWARGGARRHRARLLARRSGGRRECRHLYGPRRRRGHARGRHRQDRRRHLCLLPGGARRRAPARTWR